jgi:hypothetical protein
MNQFYPWEKFFHTLKHKNYFKKSLLLIPICRNIADKSHFQRGLLWTGIVVHWPWAFLRVTWLHLCETIEKPCFWKYCTSSSPVTSVPLGIYRSFIDYFDRQSLFIFQEGIEITEKCFLHIHFQLSKGLALTKNRYRQKLCPIRTVFIGVYFYRESRKIFFHKHMILGIAFLQVCEVLSKWMWIIWINE